MCVTVLCCAVPCRTVAYRAMDRWLKCAHVHLCSSVIDCAIFRFTYV